MTIPLLRIETLTGQPVNFKGTQLRVRSQVLQLRLPIVSGGLIWNRPVAILVDSSDSQERILPVPDPTRVAVLTLMGLCVVSMFLMMLFKRKTA